MCSDWGKTKSTPNPSNSKLSLVCKSQRSLTKSRKQSWKIVIIKPFSGLNNGLQDTATADKIERSESIISTIDHNSEDTLDEQSKFHLEIY